MNFEKEMQSLHFVGELIKVTKSLTALAHLQLRPMLDKIYLKIDLKSSLVKNYNYEIKLKYIRY